MSEYSSQNPSVPTFQELQESGLFYDWCQWTEDDWKNVPQTLPNEEDYLAIQSGSINQRDPETLLREAREGNLFSMEASLLVLFQQGNVEQIKQYSQHLLQERFFFFLNGFVAEELLQAFFHITLPKEKAMELIMQDAPTRHPFEQFMIGSSFLIGNNGFVKDVAQGIYYLTLSARGGCMQGMFWLGRAYAAGTGVKQDVPFAIRCFQMTYDRGIPNSAFMLGWLCLELGTKEQLRQAIVATLPYVIYESFPKNENVEKGLRLLREARDAGDEDAARILEERETNPPHSVAALLLHQATGLQIEIKD